MITLIATVTLKGGMGPKFEQYFGCLAARVLAEEPETTVYKLCRTNDANVYKIVEFYKSREALDAHMAGLKAKGTSEVDEMVAAPIDAQILEDVAIAGS